MKIDRKKGKRGGKCIYYFESHLGELKREKEIWREREREREGEREKEREREREREKERERKRERPVA